MTLAVLSIGTALPATRVTQKDSLRIAQAISRRSPESAPWLPALYGGTGIDTRSSLLLVPTVIADILNNTQHSGSVYPADRYSR